MFPKIFNRTALPDVDTRVVRSDLLSRSGTEFSFYFFLLLFFLLLHDYRCTGSELNSLVGRDSIVVEVRKRYDGVDGSSLWSTGHESHPDWGHRLWGFIVSSPVRRTRVSVVCPPRTVGAVVSVVVGTGASGSRATSREGCPGRDGTGARGVSSRWRLTSGHTTREDCTSTGVGRRGRTSCAGPDPLSREVVRGPGLHVLGSLPDWTPLDRVFCSFLRRSCLGCSVGPVYGPPPSPVLGPPRDFRPSAGLVTLLTRLHAPATRLARQHHPSVPGFSFVTDNKTRRLSWWSSSLPLSGPETEPPRPVPYLFFL